jgi:2-keto-4-pentenoate hydratase/2-oxohepta-3-ene-1,7-dioic acid hydratase in catechol pathway
MRLMRFRATGGTPRLAAILPGEGLLDLAAAALAIGVDVPPTMERLIAAGPAGLDDVGKLIERAARTAEPSWFADPDAVTWLTPVDARFCLGAGRNFRSHLDESVKGNAGRGFELHSEFPTGFVKLPQNLVAHRARVARPPDVMEFDYEIELAAVIGAPIDRISEAAARQAIFGYTVFNDLSAREWQFREMDNRLLLIGKNFPGFGPVGPCILTADEVTNQADFALELTVNGAVRQKATCADMIFSVTELVSFWSRVGLAPGDLIATGTPEGVARHRKPDPFEYYLKPGDVVEAKIDQIGTLTTSIV